MTAVSRHVTPQINRQTNRNSALIAAIIGLDGFFLREAVAVRLTVFFTVAFFAAGFARLSATRGGRDVLLGAITAVPKPFLFLIHTL